MRTLRPWGALLIALAGCPASNSTTLTDGGAPTDGNGSDRASSGDGAGNPDGGSGTDTGTGNPGSIQPVYLGTAGDYVILAESGISTVPTSAVTGDVGISPAAASYITGFSLTADATNLFSISAQVTGRVYAPGYAQPTPSNLTTAVGDMGLAYTDAAGRAAGVTELGAGNIGGMTLTAGVYKWSTGLLVPTSMTLEGSATDVWIFQVAQGLTVSNATIVTLSGGAVSKNVFWQVAGAVELGTTAQFEGVLLGMTSITLGTGASIDGRLLAQEAVNLDQNAVMQPAP
jgi:Ice-binding-like